MERKKFNDRTGKTWRFSFLLLLLIQLSMNGCSNQVTDSPEYNDNVSKSLDETRFFEVLYDRMERIEHAVSIASQSSESPVLEDYIHLLGYENRDDFQRSSERLLAEWPEMESSKESGSDREEAEYLNSLAENFLDYYRNKKGIETGETDLIARSSDQELSCNLSYGNCMEAAIIGYFGAVFRYRLKCIPCLYYAEAALWTAILVCNRAYNRCISHIEQA